MTASCTTSNAEITLPCERPRSVSFPPTTRRNLRRLCCCKTVEFNASRGHQAGGACQGQTQRMICSVILCCSSISPIRASVCRRRWLPETQDHVYSVDSVVTCEVVCAPTHLHHSVDLPTLRGAMSQDTIQAHTRDSNHLVNESQPEPHDKSSWEVQWAYVVL